MQIGGDKKNQKVLRYNQKTYIPVILEAAALLPAFSRWGASATHRIDSYAHGSRWRSSLFHLSPRCNSNDFGYIARQRQRH
jgi:hypothetical protein